MEEKKVVEQILDEMELVLNPGYTIEDVIEYHHFLLDGMLSKEKENHTMKNTIEFLWLRENDEDKNYGWFSYS